MQNNRKNEKRINNHIYLMDTIADLYRAKHKMGIEKFMKLCRKTKLLEYICENSFVFDGLPDEEILSEAEGSINERV